MHPDPIRRNLWVNNPPQIDNDPEADIESLSDNDNEPAPVSQNLPTSQTPVDPAVKYRIKKLVRGRFEGGRREILVNWEDGSCSWEPDESFDEGLLAVINSKWTKRENVGKVIFDRGILVFTVLAISSSS